MEKEMYTQCEFACGSSTQVAWIPSRAAKVGNVIEFKDAEGSWKVIGVYSSLPEDQMMMYRDAYRTQRAASDI
jgi:hypothetical protein